MFPRSRKTPADRISMSKDFIALPYPNQILDTWSFSVDQKKGNEQGGERKRPNTYPHFFHFLTFSTQTMLPASKRKELDTLGQLLILYAVVRDCQMVTKKNGQTDKQTDNQTNRQTNRQTSKQTNRKTKRHIVVSSFYHSFHSMVDQVRYALSR